jgi:MSHA pilin protein MshA
MRGFTLIELIVTIALVGILAAVAIPRFANLGVDARVASLQGVAGSMRSAAAIVHSAYVVNGSINNAPTAIEGAQINTQYGYPDAYGDGIIAAAGISTTDFAVSHKDGVTTVKSRNAPDADTCKVEYTKAMSATTPPVVAVTSAGC